MRLSFLIRLMLFLVTLELEAPTVLEVDTDTVLLRNPDLKAQQPSAVTYHLTMKYGRSQWKSFSLDALLLQQGILLSGLFPNTPYVAFATVITRSGKKVNSPKVDFTKKCSEPSPPTNFMVNSLDNSFTQLIWNHPSIFREKITEFRVDIAFLHTRLRIKQSLKSSSIYIPIQRDTITYRIKAYLPPSTIYQLSVQALNLCGDGRPVRKDYRVPGSLGFTSVKELDVHRTETSIELKLPSVVNDTSSSAVSVFVKGSSTCSSLSVPEDLRQRVNMKKFEKGWVAARYEAPKSLPKNLTIGKDSNGYDSENCLLYPDETYVITIVVIDSVDGASSVTTFPPILPISNTTKTEPTQPNLVWLAICSAFCVFFFFLFLLYRKCQSIMALLRSPSVRRVHITPIATVGTSSDWSFDCCSHPVKLKKFELSVKRAIENGEFALQFATLPRGLMQPCQYGSLPKNKPKNRYGNLIAYDDTRVILGKGSGESDSDYINASYIHGYCKEKAYIATQGPKSDTVEDFWRMIWQEEVKIICMVVNVVENGEKICEQYWPDIEKTVEYGHISILNHNQRVYAHYTYRTFQLTTRHDTGIRKVKHLQYTGWPEQGVPMYSHSIVEYLNELRAIPPGPGPIVVHCSPGTGRTGTIILSDICLRQIAAEGTVDLFVEAKKMYKARANMLDNLQQYVLAHLMPMQCLLLLPTKIPCSDVTLERIEQLKEDVPIHMRRLAVSSWKDKALRPLEPIRSPLPEHMAKNRFPKFIPVGPSLVKVKRYPKHDTNSDYISAVSVDGVKVKGQYLASQLPLPSTVSEFWRLVAEKQVELIIVLQRPGPEDPSCIDIIPHEEPLVPVPYITVKTKSPSEVSNYFTTDKLLLTDTSKPEARWQNITVLTCDNWSLKENAEPPSPEELVTLWLASEKVSRSNGYTLVLCHDGVTGCGLYLALSFLLERMTVERECDVILAVRAVRRSRPEYVNCKEQFEYLYDAAVKLVESFGMYANFS